MSKKAKTVSKKRKAERVMVLYGLGDDKKPRAASLRKATLSSPGRPPS